MARFVVRVWLPDKPGALGGVATAIGSVGASLVGVDILEQGGGWAIDELVVECDEGKSAADEVAKALTRLGDVSVEDIRSTAEGLVDPRIDALRTAAELVEQEKPFAVLDVLVHRARHDLAADWAVVMRSDGSAPVAETGDGPSAAWLSAFIAGSRSSDALSGGRGGPDDVAWADLKRDGSVLVLGRSGRPFRYREREQLDALSSIGDGVLYLLQHE